METEGTEGTEGANDAAKKSRLPSFASGTAIVVVGTGGIVGIIFALRGVFSCFGADAEAVEVAEGVGTAVGGTATAGALNAGGPKLVNVNGAGLGLALALTLGFPPSPTPFPAAEEVSKGETPNASNTPGDAYCFPPLPFPYPFP